MLQQLDAKPVANKSTRPKRAVKREPISDDEETDEQPEAEAEPVRKRRGFFLDREKIDYARELMDNRLTNKEMSELLELSIACVRKLKSKILDGTAEELVDNAEEHYKNMIKVDPDSKIS